MTDSNPTRRDIRRNLWFCKELAERHQGCSHAQLVMLLQLCEAMQEELTAVYRSWEYGEAKVYRRLGTDIDMRRRDARTDGA